MNDQQRFWVKHCIDLSAAELGTDMAVLERLYTPAEIAYKHWFHDAMLRAYDVLSSGVQTDPYTRLVADFLLAYADAHLYFWNGLTMPEFYDAMAIAWQTLRAALDKRATGFNAVQAAHDVLEAV